MKYDPSEEQMADIGNRFTHHPPKDDHPSRYSELRAMGAELATAILVYTPPSREQSFALDNLEQAVMWANAAIARHE